MTEKKRKSIDSLGPLQKSIMDVVWKKGEASVNDVLALMKPKRELAYTTVLSAMQKLEKAGWLGHREVGRTYAYFAKHSRENEGNRAFRNFIKQVFHGDPLLAFHHLIEHPELNSEDMDELRRMIQVRKKEMEG